MNLNTENIWNGCGNGLRAFISHRMNNPSDAEDILQDVFLKIHSNIGSLKDDTRICSWVYRIARNAIIDFYRKHKVKPVSLDDGLLDDEGSLLSDGDIWEASAEKDISSGLREVVEALPQKYSQPLIMVEFQGMSQAELAKQLGISVSGAKSRIRRGRLMIRDALMRCCHFEFDRYGTIIDYSPACCCCSRECDA